MLGFRDTEADRIAELEAKVFGAKVSKAKLRRAAYKAVLNQLAAIQERNDYSQAEMAEAVANLGTVAINLKLNVSVKTKRGAK